MTTKNRIFFERLTNEYNIIFDYTSQEGLKLNILNPTIIKSEHSLRIDQIDYIINNIIQYYLVTKKNQEIKFQRSHFLVETSFEKDHFIYTPLIGDDLKIERHHRGSLNPWISVLMYITVQTCYAIQYPTMQLRGYINDPEEAEFLALRHGI